MEPTTPQRWVDRQLAGNSRMWLPTIWLGMNSFAWLRLLARNRFAIGLPYVHVAIINLLVGFFNTPLRWVQTALYGRRVARTAITEPPVCIIGHWRSGTTLLHELLCLDERHTYPTTYECFAPSYFLISEDFANRWLRWLVPSHRPTDDMAVAWGRPQEDEFALCNLGQPSPYLTIAFPNRPPQFPEYLDLESLTPDALRNWKRSLLHFLKQIAFKNPKRIILKSPVHTFRLKILLELFPEARFVHIVRDPYVVFPSTVHLWRSLYAIQGLQRPTYEGLHEYVFETFIHMHEKLKLTRQLVPPSRFCELRYEELVRNPIEQMRALYQKLDLGDFERVLPALKEYLEGVKNYRPNRYELSPEVRDEVTRRWGSFIQQYGYSDGQTGT
jgi:hypothetical protein